MNLRRTGWGLTLVGLLLSALVVWDNLGDGVDVKSEAAGSLSTSALKPAPEVLAQGQYLIRAGNCMACHTARGGAPMAGGRGIETPFGTVYSSNLTPDLETGIGQWNAAHFWRALHHGRSRDGHLLTPAFPYNHTTLISRADADAMFAWLQSQPPVHQKPPEHTLQWPLGTQPALAVWRALYFKAGLYENQKTQSAEWNRGAYLVQGLGHCAACHSARNALGASGAVDALSGGKMAVVNWTAPSLVDDTQTGLGQASLEDIQTLLRTGQSGSHHTSGPMAEVVRLSTQYLSAPDLRAMAVYLKSRVQPNPAVAENSAPGRLAQPGAQLAVRPATASRGAAIYDKQCAQCHGDQGQGEAEAYPALAGLRAVLQKDTTNLVQNLLYGGYPPATAGNPRPYGMPPFILTLDDKDMAAVLTHVRSQWGNSGPEVTPLEVHRIRALQGS
jgi:mono/diheme cytochrome c family protein